jgi:hypothetical protein
MRVLLLLWMLSSFAFAALFSFGAQASDLPSLKCELVTAPGATCTWQVDQPDCTWEEGGTPTVCKPLAGANIDLRTAGTYRGGYNNASASNSVVYDPKTRRMFVSNAATQTVDVVNLGDNAVDANRPKRLHKACSLNVANSGYKPFNLAFRKDGMLAVVLQQGDDATKQGKIALVNAREIKPLPGSNDCTAPPLKVVDVGFMPAQASFTADHKHLLVTNEGEPSQDYLTDPIGEVSIIDLRDGIDEAKESARVNFEQFDSMKEQLIADGVRITGPDLSTPDPTDTTSVAKDLEPEGIAVSTDSRFAWITLPENNAVATLDIRHAEFTAIRSFGSKDYSQEGSGLDPTDNDGPPPNIQTWPIRGMYMPKQVAVAAPLGAPVLVYPNRGVRRSLDAYGDEVRLSDLPIKEPIFRDLDPTVFPPNDANTIALRKLRLKVSWVDGDGNEDGYLEQIYAFGGRSYSIRLPNNKLIFDSGDDFEQITAQAWRDTDGYFLFNTPDDENRFDDNSDLRGPEPVSVTTGRIGFRSYAFIGLERVGGVLAYDITNPLKPAFQSYINNRNFHLNPKDGSGVCVKRQRETGNCPNVGDQSAEEILFISANESPIRAPLIVVSNTTSGSATILRIDRAGR